MGAIAIAWLALECVRDPKINFLPRDGRAEWILFPSAVDAKTHRIVSLDTTFRREFTLDNRPRTAQLGVRGAKRVELKINGASVDVGTSGKWKEISIVDVFSFLRTGTNRIEARVFNDNGPPSFWLFFNADRVALRSDQTWEASFAGSAWRSAALASVPRFPSAGNPIAGGETLTVLPGIWRMQAVLGAIALVICATCFWWAHRFQRAEAKLSLNQVVLILAVTVAFWVLLFWNNAGLMPFYSGFDAQHHVNYIEYVLEDHALPLPTQGFEMYQPPLYYALCAAVLAIAKLTTNDPSAIFALRFCTMLFGIAQFTLVFLTLRLLLPQRVVLQLVGLLLAAFLPMQLYLSHYVTNETLAAALVTASVYLAFRLWQTVEPSLFQYIWLGACTGAAILTKTTAVLLVPPLFLAVVARLPAQRSTIGTRVRNLVVMVMICFVFCGWHYLRIWYRFGTPFLGNWNVASGFSWWQEPGYRIGADYVRFGRSFTAPLFSGLNGFWDGIYSTSWGDGLCGGKADLAYRPPWNYDMMIGGYLLATVPALLILTGAIVTVWRFVWKPSAENFVLLGLSAAIALGLIFITLKVPSYAQVKAFYGLSALVPICFFGAIGWEVATRGRQLLQFMLSMALLVWAMNSFASYWIRHSADQHIYMARSLTSSHKPELAISEANKAVTADPLKAAATEVLAAALDDSGRSADALVEAERATVVDPLDSGCHLQLGIVLAKQGQVERAIKETRRAMELGPENSFAYDLLVACLLDLRDNEQAIDVARNALAVSPFSAELHRNLGLALAQEGDLVPAANQFAYALLLRPAWAEVNSDLRHALFFLAHSGPARLREAAASVPDSPQMLNELAWVLATNSDLTLRSGADAVRLAEHGCAITGRKDPALVATLAAAYGELRRFPDGINTAEEALSLARSSGDANAATLSRKLLDSFRANRPYREEPIYK